MEGGATPFHPKDAVLKTHQGVQSSVFAQEQAGGQERVTKAE